MVFRTNAVAGDYADSDVWVALIAPDANPYTPEDYDYSAGAALYRWAGSLQSPAGATQVLNPYGVPGEQIDDWVELKTPEGYAVYKTQNGSAWDIYLEASAGHFEMFTKDGTPPGDWDTSIRSNRTFLANHQEVYDGRAATSLDPDFDGVSTIDENKCGLDPNDNDTDSEGGAKLWTTGQRTPHLYAQTLRNTR